MCISVSSSKVVSHPGVGSCSELNIYHLARRGLVRSRCSWFSGRIVLSYLVLVKNTLAITLEVTLITRGQVRVM